MTTDGAHYVRNEHYFLVALRSDTQIPRNKKDAGQFQVIWVPAEQAEQQLTYAAEQEVVHKACAGVPAAVRSGVRSRVKSHEQQKSGDVVLHLLVFSQIGQCVRGSA